MKKRWSLWWWAPPVVLGLAAALIPAEPDYSPRSFSDDLVAVRQVLLASAAIYLFGLLIFRFVYAGFTVRPEDRQRGFEILPPNQKAYGDKRQ